MRGNLVITTATSGARRYFFMLSTIASLASSVVLSLTATRHSSLCSPSESLRENWISPFSSIVNMPDSDGSSVTVTESTHPGVIFVVVVTSGSGFGGVSCPRATPVMSRNSRVIVKKMFRALMVFPHFYSLRPL
jgi:hypothetical protein